jgi:cyanophycinase
VRGTLARVVALAGLALAAASCAQVDAWLPWKSPSPEPEVAPEPKTPGNLLLSGGGRIAGAVIAEAARLTDGTTGAVLVVPLGSTARDPGRATADVWARAGFSGVEILDAADPEHAARQIDAASFIWMTGGDANRLVDRLLAPGLAERLRARFEAGALVGGNSTGATAAAELFLVGSPDDDEMQQGRADVAGGLGLLPGVIADASFVAKKRFNRLTAAVLDHPTYIGLGIDEGTGVVVTGTSLRVVGDGNVVVIDARRAQVASSRPGDASAATGVEMHVLAAGMTFDVGTR